MNKKLSTFITALVPILVLIWIFGCSAAPTKEISINQPPDAVSETKEIPKEESQDDQSQVSQSQPQQPQQDIPPADSLTARLFGLTIDEFFEASWRELMMRDPEWVLAEGMAQEYGLQGVTLTDISDGYIRETQQMYTTVLELLHTYNRDDFTAQQQISFDVYKWYLNDTVLGAEFMYYDYPATFFPVTAVHEGMIYFFTGLHPVASKQDAEDYITRLQQVDTKFAQLVERLKLGEQAGVVPPEFAVQWALYGVNNMANASPATTPYYQAFSERVNQLTGLSSDEKQELLNAAEGAVKEAVIPAYIDLAQYLQHQESIAPTDEGVWQFNEGDAYYEYLLRHYTTTDMTADEIHEIGLQELDRIQAEIRAIANQLGYPEGESLTELYNRVAKDGGYVTSADVIESYESIIYEADQNLDAAFNIRPQAELIVIRSSIKGMYVNASLDGTRPATFHAGPGNTTEEYYAMPTLAYHEGVPGHHLQISLAQEAELPTFRNLITFLGYAEGWALYAEKLAFELGWYEKDPYGNLGRLQAEAFRAARLVVDTGIHDQGWTFEQAERFFTENTGFEPGDSVEPNLQIARYIVWPGQSTSYKIGMLKILQLHQKAMDQLGERFDLKEFHNVVLSNGSMPLDVLERVIDNYIKEKMSQSATPKNPFSWRKRVFPCLI